MLAAVVLAACAGGAAEVAGVTVEVPAGWRETGATTEASEVVAAAGWRGGPDDSSTLQVVVGCGSGTASELAAGAATRARPPLEVTTADEPDEVEIPGAEDALELRFSLGGDAASEVADLRVAGRYATVADTLVLVEVSTPVDDPQREMVDATLESIELDPAELTRACGSD